MGKLNKRSLPPHTPPQSLDGPADFLSHRDPAPRSLPIPCSPFKKGCFWSVPFPPPLRARARQWHALASASNMAPLLSRRHDNRRSRPPPLFHEKPTKKNRRSMPKRLLTSTQPPTSAHHHPRGSTLRK
ncbi:hypothetical protein BC940DRAFT_302115 [Gongronella butleri]|nr:hypothetical protein BC940DRAFT_302115 [Gongronella butleri]